MPIQLPALDTLETSQIEVRQLRLASLIEDVAPGIDLQRGVLHDLVLRLNAIVGQATSDASQLLINSVNPLLSAQNIGSIDSQLLTEAALAQGVTRQNGSVADGKIAIVVDRNRILMIARGTSFTLADGRRFTVPSAYAGLTVGTEPTDDTDVPLSARTDGNFELIVAAVSETEGLAGNVVRGVEFVSVSQDIPGFVSAYVFSDFGGGNNVETDSQLISRMLQTIPASSLSTRASVPSVIRQNLPAIPLYSVSTIGYGDAELTRGESSMAGCGRADIYVRTAQLPITVEVSLTGEVTEVVPGNRATWRIVIPRDALPGLYDARRVLDSGGVSYQMGTLVFDTDSTPVSDILIPEISTPAQSAFSRFSTAILTVSSPSGELEVGDQQSFSVELRGMPGIADIQLLLGDRSHRFVGGDALVRAAIPTFISVGIQVAVRSGVVVPDPSSIRESVANLFNLGGFTSRVHASRVSTIANNLLPDGASVKRVDMRSTTLMPDGTLRVTQSDVEAVVPVETLLSVSGRTSVFICYPGNVQVTAIEEIVPRVV